ncbi:hypothetical protein [Microvirga flavescens]|uniref:hypothetical protein n=1 Tax=Microvirga flavescens TaxID=2249811 RepID=UPI000DD52037|nr:hypothetical protein [Microvirga flavescens]
MFSLLRTVAVIGVIFYLSPVRTEDALPSFASWFGWPEEKVAAKHETAEDSPARLETMWQALPEGAKQAILAKIMSESGLTASTTKPQAAPSDTLHTDDKKAAWRGSEPQKPRS